MTISGPTDLSTVARGRHPRGLVARSLGLVTWAEIERAPGGPGAFAGQAASQTAARRRAVPRLGDGSSSFPSPSARGPFFPASFGAANTPPKDTIT